MLESAPAESSNLKKYADEAMQVLKRAEQLYDRAAVEAALDRLAVELSAKVADERPVIMSVLNGGIIPAGLLLPRLHFPLQLDTVYASRYGANTSGGELRWRKAPSFTVQDQTVVLVDDILDEGKTLATIRDFCLEQNAKAVYMLVLVNKLHDRKFKNIQADMVGLTVPDRYVFGYGMDYKGYLRNADGIYAVNQET